MQTRILNENKELISLKFCFIKVLIIVWLVPKSINLRNDTIEIIYTQSEYWLSPKFSTQYFTKIKSTIALDTLTITLKKVLFKTCFSLKT